MTKIRLMQVTHDLAVGGLQQVVLNICRTINLEMFDVSVLCLRALGEFAPLVERLGVRVELLPQTVRTDYLSFFKVARIFRRDGVQVIHTHNTQPFIDGSLAAAMSGVHTIVHTDHGRIFPDKRRYMFAEWLVSHGAYRVVGVSTKTTADLARYERISTGKMHTIPNGIDLQRFGVSIDRGALRARLNIGGSGAIIGAATRLSPEKGVSCLLQAMSHIRERLPDATLVIAGTGPLENALREEASRLSVADRVRFLGARLDMPEIFSLFDVFVLPSLSEGLPMVLLEAMAADCPIVATRVGGVPNLVVHGFTGSLVEAGDSDGLAGAVMSLLSQPDVRRRYVKNAHELFLQDYSAATMTRRYERLYLRQPLGE